MGALKLDMAPTTDKKVIQCPPHDVSYYYIIMWLAILIPFYSFAQDETHPDRLQELCDIVNQDMAKCA